MNRWIPGRRRPWRPGGTSPTATSPTSSSSGRFDQVDLLVALDRRHQQTLRSLGGPAPLDGRLVLLRTFDRNAGGAVDVPDPYYGDDGDFARCLSLVEAACRGLATTLATALGDPAEARP